MRKAFLRLVFSTPERVWIAVALGLRLAFALKVGDRFHQIDEVGFDAPAWLLATTGSFRVDGQTLVVPPVPNAFFAFFYWLFGRHMLYPRLAQAAVSAGTAWVLGRMTGTLTGSCRAGRLALVTAAVYPFFIYYSGMLLSESLYIAASTLGLWWLCQSLQERGACRWRAPASGLALALAALCRAEGAPIAALIWLGAMLPCLMGRWPWRTWLTAVLMWVMPLLAWSGRNQAAVGSFALDNHGGMAMLHGNLLFDLNEIDTAMAQAELEQIPFYRESLHLSPPLRDRIYIRESLRFIRANPGKVLRQWAEKFVNFWRFYPRTDKAYHETRHSHPGAGLSRTALVIISLAFEPALILGGLWGFWVLRRRWSELFPCALFTLGTMLIHVVSVSQMRYRLPVMPVLILGATAWTAALFKQDCRPEDRA